MKGRSGGRASLPLSWVWELLRGRCGSPPWTWVDGAEQASPFLSHASLVPGALGQEMRSQSCWAAPYCPRKPGLEHGAWALHKGRTQGSQETSFCAGSLTRHCKASPIPRLPAAPCGSYSVLQPAGTVPFSKSLVNQGCPSCGI